MTKEKLTPKNIGEGIDEINPKAFGLKTQNSSVSSPRNKTILIMDDEEEQQKAENIKDPTLRRRAILRELQNDPYYDDTPTLDDGSYKRQKKYNTKTIALIAIAIAIMAFCIIQIIIGIYNYNF